MNSNESAGSYSSEAVYGTHEDSHSVMSEKVQHLAGDIYNEFERMIQHYDKDVVKNLMPLLVNVLECLNSSYQTNQEHDVELELLREDNEQLLTQFEREKAGRKLAEQKILELEDQNEGERKELQEKLSSVGTIVRMLELKHKNSLDHVNRLEERESEHRREFSKLHERYTELFKTHMEYMERTKLLLNSSAERSDVRVRLNLNTMGRSSGHVSFGFSSLDGLVLDQTDSAQGSPKSPSPKSPASPASPKNQARPKSPEGPSSPSCSPIGDILNEHDTEQNTSRPKSHSSPLCSPIVDASTVHATEHAYPSDVIPQQNNQATSTVAIKATKGKSQTKSENRSGNTLYQVLSFNDADCNIAETEDVDYTGSWVHPSEYASSVNDNFFGMGKEVENIIQENNELLATKNALNVVKDDLIVKVDELTAEQEILREKISSVSAERDKLRERVSGLEEELRNIKQESLSNSAGNGANEDEAEVPLAQRKRFTRVEMARVLMERNQYKERFIELQDAVRYSEMVRARRDTMSTDKKKTIWSFFSKLFNASDRPTRPLSTPHLRAVVAPQSAMRHSRTQADFLETQISADHLAQRRQDRAEQFRQVRAHVHKDDGRSQAYGWSLPGKSAQNPKGPTLSGGVVPVPVPVFCKPIAENDPTMMLLCAAGVNVNGGHTPDGGCMVGESVFYAYHDKTPPNDNLLSLACEMSNAEIPEAGEDESNMTSLVWICCSTQLHGIVMVIDANKPNVVIDSFCLHEKHIMCIASVPGAIADDYKEFDDKASDYIPEEPVVTQSPPKPDAGETASANTENPSESTSTDDGEKQSEVVVGSVKLMEAIILTPPQTPTKLSMPCAPTRPDETPQDTIRNILDELPDLNSDPDPQFSPPLSSSPIPGVDINLASPEAGVDAFAQEQSTANASKKENIGEPRNMSTVMATMWIGTRSGNLYVHSAIGNYGKCLSKIKLKDAILSIVPCASRCVVALADGTVAIFSRLPDGQWDFTHYWLVTLGDPKCSVRCLSAVGLTVWCGYRNNVHVLDPRTRTLLHTLEAHPRHDSQVRQMAWLGDGVWVSIKMDSTLRLYHALTYDHLMDVDIEPYVSKMLGAGKVGFSLVRITALLISTGRLWIGTSNGVIISVPLSEDRDMVGANLTAVRTSLPGMETGNRIPWCSMAHAQLSFHGHRDAVTFFVAVPGAPEPPKRSNMLLLSGGVGYIDFRIADPVMEDSVVLSNEETGATRTVRDGRAHLIVWQVALS